MGVLMNPRLFLVRSDTEPDDSCSAGDPGPVLVVEDDDINRGELRDLLADQGYAVVEAADGKQALEYLIDRRRRTPALILLDLSMPVMTGWELLAILKSYVRLANIPVVLLSGVDPQLDPVKHGVIAQHVRKPYDSERLLTVVASYVDTPRTSASVQ
jgi:CheY-like chemotaxis protein